jgi:hypothetical protein
MTQPTTSGSGAEFDAPSTVEPKKPEKSSLLDDFMDIFYAPSAVFARRANAGFWIPLLIVSVLLGVMFFANRDLIEPIMDSEFSRNMARNPRAAQMTPDQMATAKAFAGKIGMIAAFVFPPLVMLGLGVVIWIVGKFFDSKQTVNAAIVVAVFSYVPRVVEGVVTRIEGLIIDPSTINGRYSLSLGLGRFFDPDTASPILLGLIGRIDVFTIWITVLIAIGIAVTGKISRGRAAIAAAIVWLVGALPTLAGTLGQ